VRVVKVMCVGVGVGVGVVVVKECVFREGFVCFVFTACMRGCVRVRAV
jgi:hypothetical protein